MIDTIIKFFRYLCGSISCSCKSSCIDKCQNHQDKCVCECVKKNNKSPKAIQQPDNKSLKEVSKK